jgi:hypothetical protein
MNWRKQAKNRGISPQKWAADLPKDQCGDYTVCNTADSGKYFAKYRR